MAQASFGGLYCFRFAVYTALDQKAVDGATNPLVTIPVMKFNEVQK
jgi:TRAP-type C4-dicarboxylate transport system substrate-binding protein